MNDGRDPSPFLLKLASLLAPRGRREETLTDLREGFSARASRLGHAGARRHLYREVVSLFLWRTRFWRGTTATRETAEATAMKSNELGRDFFQDLRFGARTLLRRPTFTFMTVMVLGLGIGAPTTVLTVLDTIFSEQSTRIDDPDRILRLQSSQEGRSWAGALGNADYLYYRENASTLEGLAAYGGSQFVPFTADGLRHDQLRVLFVSGNFFDLLGIDPAVGRTFLPEENATPGTHPVVVLNFNFWSRALGRDPDVVGNTLTLGGSPYTVVGVAEEGFGSVSPAGTAPDAWVPIAMYGELLRARTMDWWEWVPGSRSRWLVGLGRLAPGVTYEAARDNLVALGRSLEYEGKDEGEGAHVQSQFLYSPGLARTLTALSRMLLVGVGIVFLVAIFNVALLLLSRAANRYREMGIRAAMGAGRGRITRQVMAETLLLGTAGGGLGIALAFSLSGLAASLLPVRFSTQFHPGERVIFCAVGLSLLTALAVGLFPALHASGGNLGARIQAKEAGASSHRVRDALIVAQVSLSLVLVAGAFLFGRSFWTARTQELGFATENRLVLNVGLHELGYVGDEGRAFLRQALERVAEIPGVVGVSGTRMIPFQGDWTSDFDAPPGARSNLEGNLITTGMNVVTPGYFQVAEIPILRGRPLGPQDVTGSPPAVVINEALAEAIWPGQDPLGRTLPIRDDADFEVVGVARTANYYSLGESPQPQAYLAYDQYLQYSVHFLIRTSGSATAMAPVVQEALRGLDPRLVFGWVTTMEAVVEGETGRYEVSAVLVGLFSLVALILAAAGLYGTISFLVARRTREIGVRMALGAHRGRVAGEVMRAGMKLVLFGVALGLIGAVFLRRFTEGMLYGIAPEDPLPLVGACIVLLGVSALATFSPARKATRVDPAVAIRIE